MKLEGLCLLIFCLSFVVAGTYTRSYDAEKHPIDDETVDHNEELEEGNTYSSKDKRAAAMVNGSEGGYRWTNSHIPYQLAPDTFNAYEKSEITDAMDIWAQYTCLTFAPATSGNRLYFYNGKGCTSYVGMKGGAQNVSLGPRCRKTDVVLHEIGHAIGLQHEHERPDRDSYVQIITKNVLDDKKKLLLKKLSWNAVKNLGIKYDYLSIMHYASHTFSKNKDTTIETKDSAYQSVIGKLGRLSFRDIKTVNLMQKCAEANKCKLRDGDCPGEGFVGKDCKCWCTGSPYKLCDMNGSTDSYCQDYDTNCPAWAGNGRCTNSTFNKFMATKCPKACRLCTDCKDHGSGCAGLGKKGYCTKDALKKVMAKICRKTCGLCTADTTL